MYHRVHVADQKGGLGLQFSTLRAPDSPLLRIQSLPYRPPGLPGKDYFRTTVFFSRQLCNLACRVLIGWWKDYFSPECIHRTTLSCNITPNISSKLRWPFHGARTEAARQYEGRRTWALTLGREARATGLSHTPASSLQYSAFLIQTSSCTIPPWLRIMNREAIASLLNREPGASFTDLSDQR